MVVVQALSESGGTVALEFGGGGVRVREISAARLRMLRSLCGLAFLAFGVGAVAVNIDTQGSASVGDWFWVAAGVLVLGCAGAAVRWLVEVVRDRRRPVGVITSADVVEGRSVLAAGTVTVSLTMVDGGERSFSANGHHGAVLADQFGILLAVAA